MIALVDEQIVITQASGLEDLYQSINVYSMIHAAVVMFEPLLKEFVLVTKQHF